MKILHCCLANFYIDDYSYQENVLPKMHKLAGHQVEILASTETYITKTQMGYVKESIYFSSDNIKVTRIPYIKYLPHIIVKKIRLYNGIQQKLNEFKPDILFLHGCQFLDIISFAKYKKQNPNVIIYVDGHTDFINSGKNWVSKNILHKIIYKWCAKKIEPYVEKFYGVLPIRVDFFKEVYKIDRKKVELLVLGADHTVIDLKEREKIKKEVRKRLKIEENDLVIITGGKIDKRKNIGMLLKVVDNLQIKNLKLILIGIPDNDTNNEINSFVNNENIKYVGWLNNEETYRHIIAADISFYPGTHSVLWELSLGLGVPVVFKKWKGMEHLVLSKYDIILDEVNELVLENTILQIVNDKVQLDEMKKVAIKVGMKKFSYFEIAKNAIENKTAILI